MLKKIATNKLEPGMFVVDLNAGWMDHPFIRNRLELVPDDIALIREAGIREVTIDTQLGLDSADAPSLESVRREEDRQITQLANAQAPLAQEPVSAFNKARARQAVGLAVGTVRQLMQDARMGQAIDFSILGGIASELAREVVANPAIAVALHHLHKTCEYTYGHSVRVAAYMVACAHRMGLDETTCQHIALGGLIHDLGKMRVRQETLRKASKLTADEMAHMREHVVLGSELLQNLSLPIPALAILEEHHERFDGKGYPRQLSGEAISLFGRIAGIADVYDAISSDRWYQTALPAAAAIRKIFEWSKYHFDPEVAGHFIRSIGIYPVGSLVRLDNKRLALVVEHRPHQPLYPRVLPVFDLHGNRPLHAAKELDLAERQHIHIMHFEDPESWGIDPADYL